MTNDPFQNKNLIPKTPLPRPKRLYVLRRLWKYLYRYKWLLLAAFVLTVLSNLLALWGPLLSGYAIDALKLGRGAVDFEKVYFYAALMLVFYIASALLNCLLSVIMIKLSRNVVNRMRKDVFDKLMNLPVGFFDNHQTGEILSNISYDIETINTSLSNDLLQLSTSIITVAGSFIMMLTISPRLILICLITIPISVLITRYRAKKVRPLFGKRSEKLGELNGYIEEITSGQKTIKAYGREQIMTERFNIKNSEAVEAYFKADYYNSVTGPSVNFINNLSLALISIFGAVMYMAGSLSLGSISSFVLYSRKFSGPINEFSNIVSDLQSSLAAAERVFKLLDTAPEPKDAENAYELKDICGEVKIENLYFGYEPGKNIIKNFNLDAPSGSKIAIVGPTGAGKTTIINLLMRFYDTENGALFIDGRNIKEVTVKSLRNSFTMVLQDAWLFHGTIFENIAYGRENVTLNEVIEAAKAAKIHKYIMSLPEGYDTVLTDNGVNISKGQKQLLTIARAMLVKSRMLIFDEATSNVDTQTERRIQDAMLKLMENRTCFIIAHRLSTIKNADSIIVVKDGEIAERGTHRELINNRGLYFKLYHSQFD